MGGRLDLDAGYREVEGRPVLAMRGRVRLDNNGGFIQLRLPLDPGGALFDASGVAGLRVTARALEPGAYYLHLRSEDTRRPWAYYRARLNLSREWETLELPWSDFEARSLDQALNPERLRSVALVTYGEAFEADLDVARIEWW